MSKRNELKQRLGPGFWIDQEDNLHVSIIEILDGFGIADTPENRALVQKDIKQMMDAVQRAHGTMVETVHASGRCPRCKHDRLKRGNGVVTCERCQWAGSDEQCLEY